MRARREHWRSAIVSAALGAIVIPWIASAQPPAVAPRPESMLDNAPLPIDLASALLLANLRNPEILLARERVTEATAQRQLAAAQLLPNLHTGTNYNTHTGPLQAAAGTIVNVNRGGLYLGLGAAAVGAGTVNIPGIAWSGNVSETWFDILASRQVVRQREFASAAVQNQTLLRVAVGYVELMRAEGRRAVAAQNRAEAAEVARVTAAYARVGQGRQADADRAATELEQRNAEVISAEADVLTASARLCQLLDLDPATRLTIADMAVVPAPIVPDPIPLNELLAIALTQRPELGEQRAAIQEALVALQASRLLPFSPNLLLGYSAGTFGGGSNLAAAGVVQPDGTILRQSRFGNFDGRQDFDAVVWWTLHYLGVGNVAIVRVAESRLRAGNYRELEVLNRVRAELATAFARSQARLAQIEVGEQAVHVSAKGFREDLLRTRNREGLPIEVLDSLRLLGRSRLAYLDAICDYNRAQFELYVALGQPPADHLARPIPNELLPKELPAAPAAGK